eukprot:tig00020563_g11392.t1
MTRPAAFARRLSGLTAPEAMSHASKRAKGTNMPSTTNIEEDWNKIKNGGIVKLQEVVDSGFTATLTSAEFMALYTLVYNLCAKPGEEGKKNSQELYDRYKEAVNAYLVERVLPAVRDKHDSYLLEEFVKRWDNHKVMVKWYLKFFAYLDRFHIPREKLKPLNDLGTHLFHETVFDAVKKDVRLVLLGMVRKERDGERVDRTLMKNTIQIFVDMDANNMSTYASDFEEAFLQETAEFYSRESARWIEECSCPEYMRKAEACLEEEKGRIGHYLNQSSETKLMKVCEDQLLERTEEKLLEMENSGCEALLRDNKTDDLSRMFRLFSRLQSGLQPIARIFKKHISDEGLALVESQQNSEDTQAYIMKLIAMHDKYNGLVNKCFASNPVFHKALSEAFIVFVNKEGVGKKSTAELLASFCDNMLKKGTEKDHPEEERDQILDKVVQLLRYILGTDVFEAFYKNDLARRLIMQKSISQDIEKSMISKLKTECGSQFTNKLEVMLRDLDLSKDITTNFRQHAKNQAKAGDVELNVQVLTTGFWPNVTPMDLKLPKELGEFQEMFKTYYLGKHSGRKLTWHYAWSICMLKANYPKGRRELQVSLYQAVILLLFNDTDTLSLKDLSEQTGMDEKELKRNMIGMTMSKVKLLNKSPNTKELKDDDVFSFNTEFTAKMYRIKVNSIQMKETQEENQQTNKRVFQDRQYQIDAAIVRIMKTRKTLSHTLLVSEIYNQLKFPFKPADIKKRIESLIEREYLQRDKDNPQVYIYMP